MRLRRISDAVRAHAARVEPRDEPFIEAAVAVVLRTTAADSIELLFIKRAERDDDPWSGQIALPGGRHEKADESLETTAVRETLEEVALDLLSDGEIIGPLDELRPRIQRLPPVIVRPFVATVSDRVNVTASNEVAEFFWAPLNVILDPDSARPTDINAGGVLVRRPAIHYRGHVIWGMTERILRDFAEIAG